MTTFKLQIIVLSLFLGASTISHAQGCLSSQRSGPRCEKLDERTEMRYVGDRSYSDTYGRREGRRSRPVQNPYYEGYEYKNRARACNTHGKDKTFKGAGIGGLLGAIGGGLINGKKGALVGAASGAVLGGLAGNSVDRDEEIEACMLGALCDDFEQDHYYYVSKRSNNHFVSHQAGSLYSDANIRCRQYQGVIYEPGSNLRSDSYFVQYCLVYDGKCLEYDDGKCLVYDGGSYVWEAIDESDFVPD